VIADLKQETPPTAKGRRDQAVRVVLSLASQESGFSASSKAIDLVPAIGLEPTTY